MHESSASYGKVDLVRFTLRQLSYFIATAELRSVSLAAKRLNVSQPAISAGISHLEEIFGFPLFIRHHARGVSLTPEGRRILIDATQVMDGARRFSKYSIESAGIRGEIDLGFFVTIGPLFLPKLLKVFCDAHREVTIRLHEGDSDQLYHGLNSGRFDLAIGYDFIDGPNVTREVLFERTPFVLLPKAHPLAKEKSIYLSQLKDDEFIIHDQTYSRKYYFDVFEACRISPSVKYYTSSIEMVRGLVANGHGVSILNTRPAGDRSYDGSSLAYIDISDSVPPLRIVLCYMEQSKPSYAVRAFVESIKRYFLS